MACGRRWEVGLKIGGRKEVVLQNILNVDFQNWLEVGDWPPKKCGTEVETPATHPSSVFGGGGGNSVSI